MSGQPVQPLFHRNRIGGVLDPDKGTRNCDCATCFKHTVRVAQFPLFQAQLCAGHSIRPARPICPSGAKRASETTATRLMTGITAVQAQFDARPAGTALTERVVGASFRPATPPSNPPRLVATSTSCLNFCDAPPAPAAESLTVVEIRRRLFRGKEQLIRT
jgi:hypothetical protein